MPDLPKDLKAWFENGRPSLTIGSYSSEDKLEGTTAIFGERRPKFTGQ